MNYSTFNNKEESGVIYKLKRWKSTEDNKNKPV